MIPRALAALALLLWSAEVSAQTVCGDGLARSSPQDAALLAFASRAGIAHRDAFRNLADYLHDDGGRGLPPCYLTKRAAAARGWRPGDDLWRIAPGAAIGGNRFANREGFLPPEWNGRYVEADLDYEGGHRGTHRLVFVRDMGERWLIFVSTNHDGNFVAFVPTR
jgi:hypothetical protein